jgi:serine phosphatase RsbU (regulator of sigma subunit)
VTATEIRDAILRAVQIHEGGERLEDDATLVVIKCEALS